MQAEPIANGIPQPVEYVEIVDDVLVPERFAARLTDLGITGVESIDITIAVEQGELVCEELVFRRSPGGSVTSDALREVPVGWLVQQLAMQRAMAKDVPPDTWLTNAEPDAKIMLPMGAATEGLQGTARQALGRRRRRVTRQMLEQVAATYRAAIDTGAPTQTVAEVFQVSHSTAARYVAKARDEGLLGETMPGKAGEITNEGTAR